jgi:WD40-like Beta Propeller Repeat
MNKRSGWLSIAGAILVLTYSSALSPDADWDPAVASVTLAPRSTGTVQQQGTVTVTPTIVPTAMTDEISTSLSPDGQFLAIVNRMAGSLDIQRTQDSDTLAVFVAGSTIDSALWSPDSHRLAIVCNNWVYKSPTGTGLEARSPIEIWQVTIEDGEMQPATRLFQSQTVATTASRGEGAEQIVLGDWSPNARYLLFWMGPLGMSGRADGLTPYVLDADTGQSIQVAYAALLNPRYHSWAPDSSALALTAGGYRSAQVNKWLVSLDTTSAQATTIISSTEQIPGIVAWSPRGDVIAYAAVSAVQTNEQLADLMTWDNPAIAGRRIYLLDPDTGKQGRLNTAESFQDAPVWSQDGLTLYYVERQGNELVVMAADPTTGQAIPVEDAREPLPGLVGYYGQSDLDELLARRSDRKRTP